MTRASLNSFPRRVHANDVIYDPARVVVFVDGVARIYAAPGGRPEVVLEGQVAELPGWVAGGGGAITVTLDDGRTVLCERRGGCGCGHVLKPWPYKDLPS